MRSLIILLSVGVAAPAVAQQPASRAVDPDAAEVQRALNDPAVTERLTSVLPALGNALLDLRVGELQAAMEGRRATEAEKRTTVRDVGSRNDPNFERNLKADLATGGETIKAGMRAMSAALPSLMASMKTMASEMEKAMANLPSPTYPRR